MNGDKCLIGLVFCGMLLGGGALLARADVSDIETQDRIESSASLTAGYRGISSHGNPGRAREYDSLEPSPLFKGKFFTDMGPYHLDLGIDYLNEDDFSTEVTLDHSAGVRLDLRSQRFYHNLDHIPYDNGYRGGEAGPPLNRILTAPPQEGSRPDAVFSGATRAFYSDQNPGDRYGLRLDMSEAKVKVKCPDYPAHLSLSYWRYEKKGEKQLRFAGENCATACHMQSKTRDIDRVTEEVKASIDAHVGFIDVILEGLLRTFRDREPVPTDDFTTHFITGGKTFLDYQHDEDPDSKLKEISLKMNTAPAGGFVVSTAFTLGERENRSDLTSVGPVEAETDYYRVSADVTYTPSEHWTVNFRYRLLDLDADNTDAFSNYYTTGANRDVQVREAMDVTRNWYEAIASYRPSKHLTVKGEFRREEIDRSNTGTSTVTHSGFSRSIVPEWDLPDEEIVTRVKLGFSSRLLAKSALKLSGWVAMQRDDDPAYGTTPEESRELFLTASYTHSPGWGVTSNVSLLRQENDDYEIHGESVDRDKQQQNFSLGTWLMPREDLSFDLYYGYLRTAIDQNLFYGSSAPYFIPRPGDEVEADFRQTVQTVTAGMTWRAREDLSCRLEGYHIRSKASYDPDFPAENFNYGSPPNIPGVASSSELRDISKVDIVQNGLKGRIDWKFSDNLTCGLEATFDDYDEKGNDVYDGSVQSYMASLTYVF